MSNEHKGMPFVPEEDLNLHEDFQPIIAENGIIRQTPHKVPAADDFTPLADATFTRMDTVQDLVQLRQAEDKKSSQESQASTNPTEAEEKPNASLPHGGGRSPVRGDEGGEQPKAAAPAEQPAPVEIPQLRSVAKKPAKKQKSAAKKAAKSGAQVPSKTPSKKPVAQQPAPAPKNTPKKSRRWPWVLAILCFLFLGGLTGMVPVEKIPLLRNIAYAMGFTKDDTARMSFLRALLTWTDKHFTLPGFLRQDEESRAALWARLRGENAPAESDLAGLQARMASVSGKTSLIDINALNALQRQKGYPLDGIRGSVAPIDGQEKNPSPAELRDSDVNVRTEANRDKGDVYFGADTSAVNRNFQDGYDSVNTLKKIANPHIANGEPIDWLKNMTQRMMRADTGLGGINRELRGTRVNWGADVSDVGDEKPQRDLYHAWITSRMSKYTSNLMLKKSLADTSFLGAEMPDIASNVLSFGGIQVDLDSLKEDQKEWEEYLEFERKCKEAINGSSTKIDDAITDFNKIVNAGASSLGYPNNCYDALQMSAPPSAFTENTAKVQQVCKQLDAGYKTLQEACHMQISPTMIACDSLSGSYEKSFSSFQAGCQTQYNSLKQKWEEEWLAQHPGETLPENAYNTQQWPKDGANLTEVDYEGSSFSSNIVLRQIKEDGGKFATWIRATCVTDSSGNVQCTPEAGEVEKVQNTISEGVLKI